MLKRYLPALLLCFTLCGCTYNGTVRRGLYQTPKAGEKLNASVLVVADRNIPQEVYITDPDDSDMQAYRLHVGDGVAVAVTDAMATFFIISFLSTSNSLCDIY